jgi:hypothetical protein
MKTILLRSTSQINSITSDRCNRVTNFAGNVAYNQLPMTRTWKRAKWHLVSLVLLVAMMLGFIRQGFAQTQTFSTPGTFSGVNGFTVPAGVTSITVEVWGGGGAGGGGNTVAAGGGGGGGYRKVTNVSVVPGTQYTIVVGAGGIGTTATGPAGGASTGTFGATVVSANGGSGGASGTPGAGGAGGTGGFTGGSGAPGVNFGHGGGGGSSAGPGTGTGINGITATSGTGAAAVTGGGAGGNGPTSGNGSQGGAPGGGGGGGIAIGSVSGGSGGNGKVVITWVPCPPPAAPSVTSPVNLCLNSTSNPLTATGSGLLWYITATGGTGSSTAPTPSTAATGTTSYYVSQTVGCEGPRAQINVIVHALPVANFSQTPITCFDAKDATITISASGGLSPYTFSVEDPANWLNATGTDLRLFTGLLPNTPYRVRVKDSNGCLSK